jgi:hypothetical protein
MKSIRTCIGIAVILACCFAGRAVKEKNVAGLYDGPFPWDNTFGFHLAGMVGHDFFKPYPVTFDLQNMQIFLQ